MRQLVASGVTHILDAAFDPDLPVRFLQSLVDRYAVQIVQIQLRCAGPVLKQRFLDRESSPARHVGHHGSEQYARIQHLLERGRSDPINIPSTLVELDTTDLSSIDYRGVYASIEAAIHGPDGLAPRPEVPAIMNDHQEMR